MPSHTDSPASALTPPSPSPNPVRLRPPVESDIELYFRLFNDEEMAFLSDDRLFRQVKEKHFLDIYRNYILREQSNYLPNVILRRQDGKAVGQIHAGNIDRDNLHCAIGFQILPEFQGQGLGYAAVITFLNFLFTEKHFHRIHAEVYDFNMPSIGLLRKAGFTLEARIREAVIRRDAWHDKFLYSILKKEFNEGPAKLSMHRREELLLAFSLPYPDPLSSDLEDGIGTLQSFYVTASELIGHCGGFIHWFNGRRGLASFPLHLKDSLVELLPVLQESGIITRWQQSETVIGLMGYPPAEHSSLYSPAVEKLFSELAEDTDPHKP